MHQSMRFRDTYIIVLIALGLASAATVLTAPPTLAQLASGIVVGLAYFIALRFAVPIPISFTYADGRMEPDGVSYLSPKEVVVICAVAIAGVGGFFPVVFAEWLDTYRRHGFRRWRLFIVNGVPVALLYLLFMSVLPSLLYQPLSLWTLFWCLGIVVGFLLWDTLMSALLFIAGEQMTASDALALAYTQGWTGALVSMPLGILCVGAYLLHPGLVLLPLGILVMYYRNQKELAKNLHMRANLEMVQRDLESRNKELSRLKDDLEAQVLVRTNELRQVQRYREEEVDNAVHDLRHRLDTMGDVVRLLAQENRVEYHHLLRRAAFACDDARGIVEDMIFASQLRQARVQITPEPLDVVILVNQVVEQLRVQADGSQCRIVVAYETVPESVPCDPRLVRVIYNVVHNAVKYTILHHPHRGGSVHVTLSSDATWCMLQVEDNGIGIDPHQLSIVTDRFQRVYQGINTPDGAGIGLHFCSAWLRLIGGTMAVESAGVGCGTTVTVCIPLHIHDTPPLVQETYEHADHSGD